MKEYKAKEKKPFFLSIVWCEEKAKDQNIPLVFRLLLVPFLIGGKI